MKKRTKSSAPPETAANPKPSAPAIFTHYDKLVDPSTLHAHPDNPNFHPRAQIEALCEVIRENGWRASIVVSKLSGCVVKGHGRLAAAIKLGLKRVPVEYQDYPDAAAEARDLVADNRIAELSSLDAAKISELRKRYAECAKGWGDTSGSGKIFQAAFDGIKEKKPKEVKFPILILETQDQFDMFNELKEAYGIKSDASLFAAILERTYNQLSQNQTEGDE